VVVTESQVSANVDAPLDPSVVDSLRRLGARSGRDVLTELTDLFLSTAYGQVDVGKQLLDRFELPELARVAHALKGSASVIGGRRAAAAAAQLETTCFAPNGTSSSEDAVRAAWAHFLAELELLRGAISELTGPT
jgi:HPt (histidine-containing phosphotransfer) domain-containing protein